jgi:DNA-binding MarR family transcriptional regulator
MEREELMTALNRAMREVSGQGVLYSQAVAERLGVGSADLECLDFIILRGSATAGELARATGLTTGAITGVIDRLERAGFARREPDPSDRRKVVVQALPAVFERITPLYQPMADASRRALESYDDETLSLLLSFLGNVRRAAVNATEQLRSKAAAELNDSAEGAPPSAGL